MSANSLFSFVSGNGSCGDHSLDRPDGSLELEDVKLEAFAETLQEQLHKKRLVQDRHFRSRTVPQAFIGKDAVTILLELLESDESIVSEAITVTREQALQVGRDIEKKFHFFCHVKNHAKISKRTKSKDCLQDNDKEMYQFKDNLPMQVYKVKQKYPSVWNKVSLLEEHLELTTHKGTIRQHKECFMAKRAVDVLMILKLVKSRREAVHLLNKMNEKVSCFVPVLALMAGGGVTELGDDDQLYRFTPKADRVAEPVRKSTSGRRSSTSSKQSKSPVRRNVSVGSNQSPTEKSHGKKDQDYFKNRALGVRNRLDIYRDQRGGGAATVA